MESNRSKQDIRNILTVLLMAIASAALVSVLFLYFYGPSGRYMAGNTLLDPKIMDQIHYQERHLGPGKKIQLEFDHIEFSYFDPKKGAVPAAPVSMESYQIFYSMVASQKSLEKLSGKVQDLFPRSHPSILTISMRVVGEREKGTNKIFQVVQLIEEDYFRVQLLDKKEGEWAYFFIPGLYEKTIQLFTPSRNPKL